MNQGVDDHRLYDVVVEQETKWPSEPFKIKGSPAYTTEAIHVATKSLALPTLRGFGRSRIGSTHNRTSDLIPSPASRAPELVLQTRTWTQAVDTWNLGSFVRPPSCQFPTALLKKRTRLAGGRNRRILFSGRTISNVSIQCTFIWRKSYLSSGHRHVSFSTRVLSRLSFSTLPVRKIHPSSASRHDRSSSSLRWLETPRRAGF